MDPAIGYAFALVFILVGLAGMVLPALPGVPLVFAGLLLAAWSDGFQHVGGFTVLLLAALTLFAVAADLVASAWQAPVPGRSPVPASAPSSACSSASPACCWGRFSVHCSRNGWCSAISGERPKPAVAPQSAC